MKARLALTLGALALTLACVPSASGAYSPPPGRYISVDVGTTHVCAVRVEGRVLCWGSNVAGEVEAPAGRFVGVSAGGDRSCAIRRDATSVCWGRGDFEQPQGKFASVSAGGDHSCGLRDDGTLACWGAEEVADELSPPAGSFTSLSSGDRHACAVRSDTTLACWGDNGSHAATPPPGGFSAVSAGLVHSCGVRSDAALVCWGGEDYFEVDVLGTPPTGSFTSVSAGHTHSCALRADATIACWGDESFDATTAPRGRFTSVSAGHVNTCAIRTNARLVCWGRDHGRAPLEAADALSLPSTRGCAGRRLLTLRVNRVPGVTFTRIVVKVRGKRVKTISRHGFTGPVRVTRLPKGSFELSITAFAIGKRPVTATRTYRACKKRPTRCGTVHIDHRETGSWEGVVEVAHGGFPCSTAMSVAGTAAAEPFGIGDRLPAPDGWFCSATFRPGLRTPQRYVLGCWQGDRLGPPPEGYSIGVRYPTS